MLKMIYLYTLVKKILFPAFSTNSFHKQLSKNLLGKKSQLAVISRQTASLFCNNKKKEEEFERKI